jgi:protein-disulfide isomerase
VTIQEFANFECSFSRKAEVTLERVLQVYQGKVRIVWRHRMLPFHQRAPLASEVAIEIFQQKGPREFWLFFQKVSEVPPEVGLQLAAMESHATQIGVDMTRFRQALQARKHRIAVQEDTRLAEELGFAGTPTFLISATGRMEGYVLEGAQSFAQFKELIDRALEDARLAPRAP